MFDQESYSFDATPAEPLSEGDLFYGYEVGRWSWSRRIYTIIGASALINLLAFTFVAQTNILTARGCDGPIIGRVCQVIDMAYVGSMIYGSDRGYVDAAYEKIDLSQADIVWIDQTGITPQLEYPAGYFQIANPEQVNSQQAMLNGTDASAFPGIPNPSFPSITPSQPGKSLIDTPAYTPKKNKNAVVGGDIDSPFADDGDSKTASTKKDGPQTNVKADPKKDQTADNGSKQPDIKSDSVEDLQINRTVLADLGNKVNDLVKNSELDLKTTFVGNAKGRLTKDGRIDPKSLKLLIESPDEDMKQVVQEGILAIDAAGYLKYLLAISGKDFDMVLKQDDANLSATIQSEMESDTRAKSIKSSLDLALGVAKARKMSANADQNDKDDLILLEGATIKTDGKRVIITFIVPKDTVHPMIERKLAEQAAANKNTLNSNFRPDQNTAAKE